MTRGREPRLVTIETDGDCCICTSHKAMTNGYPGMHRNGKQIAGHRWAYQKYVGPIPEGMCVCHSCDNRMCLNPEHLFLGTAGDNTRDMLEKGRYCKGSEHPGAKLTEGDIPLIRELLARGFTQTSIGNKFGVSRTAIYKIMKNRAWKHVVEENIG